jgi:uncharacterized protein YicC (UPF0701 family)
MQRIETVSQAGESLDKAGLTGNIDENRFEQELIYYLDKMDMNEEKVRLDNHCKYFLETVSHESPQRQEARIHCTGDRAGDKYHWVQSNDSNIQRIVVRMKDHLERIKEQLLNVL